MNTKKELARRMGEAERMIELLAQLVTEQGEAILNLTGKATAEPQSSRRRGTKPIVLHKGHLRILQTYGMHNALTPRQAVTLSGYMNLANQSLVSDLKGLGYLEPTGHIHERSHVLTITAAGWAYLGNHVDPSTSQEQEVANV